jgi:RNA polymerase sigma factor (sigma-70 family)
VEGGVTATGTGADTTSMTPILSATLLRTQSDARLVALVRQGHERAFEAIVERYRRPLHRHIRRVLPESRAEDALQQTFLKAWSSLQDGAEVHDLRPWLYRIAQNTALDALKRAGYDYDELTESLRSPGGPEADLERRTVMRETLAGLAALPGNQREALLRTAVGGDSRAQVAHDLGLTDGAVRQLVHRARATLRAAATAVTPAPVAIWAAGAAGAGEPTAAKIAELGAAGGAGLLLKGGAALVAAGVLVTGPVALNDLAKHHTLGAAPAAADAPRHHAPAAEWVANGGTGSARTGRNGTGSGDGGSRHSGRHGSGGDSSGSSGSGSSEHSGSGRREGSGGGDDHSGSGISGSGSGDDHLGSGISGSGEHSGSGGSGSGSGDTSGSGGGVLSGGDSGTSGSGTSGTSGGGSGTSSSGSDGSGSGDSLIRSGPGDGSLLPDTEH